MMTDTKPTGTITVVIDTPTDAGREIRLHLDRLCLVALHAGQPIEVEFDEAHTAVLGFAKVVVTTAQPPENVGGTVLRLV